LKELPKLYYIILIQLALLYYTNSALYFSI